MTKCSRCTIPAGSVECRAEMPGDPDIRCNRVEGHIGDHGQCDSGIHPRHAWPSTTSVRKPVEAPGAPVRPGPPPPVAKSKDPPREVTRARKRMEEHKKAKLAEADKLLKENHLAPKPSKPRKPVAPRKAQPVKKEVKVDAGPEFTDLL